MVTKIKLLPCPFCGGEAIVVKTESCGRYIGCWDCGGRTEEFETDYAGSAHDKAIAAWNRRAGNDTNVATNADRIRSMSDEELAEFLGDEPPYFATYKQYIDWLRKPIESEVEP
jgi:Lar family restriction alleviation protein